MCVSVCFIVSPCPVEVYVSINCGMMDDDGRLVSQISNMLTVWKTQL